MAAQNLAENTKRRSFGQSNGKSNGHQQKDRTLIPRTAMNTQTVARQSIPMTFDQQTQTDNKLMSGSNSEITQQVNEIVQTQNRTMKLIEQLINNQQQLLQTTSGNAQSISELTTQLGTISSNLESVLFRQSSNQSHPPNYSNTKTERSQSEYVIYEAPINETTKMSASSEGNLVIADYDNSSNGISEVTKTDISRMSFNDDTNASSYSGENSVIIMSSEPAAHSTIVTSLNGTPKPYKRIQEKKTKATVKDLENISSVWTGDVVEIGENKTPIPRNVFQNIDWSSYKAATRKLLVTAFPREVLATHSLTGRPSPGNFFLLCSNFGFSVKFF